MMQVKLDNTRKPTIVLPYMELLDINEEKDLYIYLRPETNGVKVESLIFGVIHNNEKFRNSISLAYLANLPGDFVNRFNVIEKHYTLKCKMAREGKSCFTNLMKDRFETWYGTKWENAKIVSAYEALNILNISSTELFNLWVRDKDFFYIHGQSVKKIGELYVINYDIPELLKKNSVDTDIAVMVFRSKLTNRELNTLISKMEKALKEGGAIDPTIPPRRCFHYTKSPLEEILDGLGYLYTETGEVYPLKKISFASFLIKKGISEERIKQLVFSPIVTIYEKSIEKEIYLYDYLMGDSYQEAYEKIMMIKD